MRILLVEDDELLLRGLVGGLGLDGFVIDAVSSAADARLAVMGASYDAVVLDIGLPDGSGLDLLREWRADDVSTPVLVLTARNATQDRIGGLDSGADDYLGKPFDLYELGARLRAVARRGRGSASPLLQSGDVTVNRATREVAKAGCPIELSRREFDVFAALMEQPGRVLSRAQLEERLYGWNEEVESNAVEVHIHNVRAKLGRETIETVRGVGYRVRNQ